jgi:hypothetical protein
LHQEDEQTGVDKHGEKNTNTGNPKKIRKLRNYFNLEHNFPEQ